mgnify:CR=1 FL=1
MIIYVNGGGQYIGMHPNWGPLFGVIGGILLIASTMRTPVGKASDPTVDKQDRTETYEPEEFHIHKIEEMSVTKALTLVGISTLSRIEAEAVFRALVEDHLCPKMHRLGTFYRVTIKDMDSTNWTLVKNVDPDTKNVVEFE